MLNQVLDKTRVGVVLGQRQMMLGTLAAPAEAGRWRMAEWSCILKDGDGFDFQRS